MLTESLVFLYNRTSSDIELWDKYLTTIKLSFDLEEVGDTPTRVIYDERRRKLWIASNNSRLYRYQLNSTGTAVVHEATIDIAGNLASYQGQNLAIFERTGDCYVLYGSHNKTIYRIKVDAASIDASMSIPRNEPYSTYQSYNNMCINQTTGEIIVLDNTNCSATTANTTYRWKIVHTVNSELTERYDGFSLYSMLNHYVQTGTHWVVNLDNLSTWNYKGIFAFNPKRNQIHCGKIGNYALTNFESDRHITFYSAKDMTYMSMTRFAVFAGNRTGNIYCFAPDRYILFDPQYNIIKEKIWSDFTAPDYELNPSTEEIYRWDGTNVHIYNRFGDEIANSSYFTALAPQLFSVLPGQEEVCPTDISDNVIVYPFYGNNVETDRPTLIFRVAISLKDYTQQFRLVGDRDATKISNVKIIDDVSGFGFVADSFTNGTYYKDCTWKYSLDYDESSYDPDNGTWNPLGTGDGTTGTGSEPTNGLNNETYAYKYVKLTIPDANALDGILTNDVWYFKVFSMY